MSIPLGDGTLSSEPLVAEAQSQTRAEQVEEDVHECCHSVIKRAQWGSYYFYSHLAERLNNVPSHTAYKELSPNVNPGSLTAEVMLVTT